MNELICVLIIIGVLIVVAPVTFCICKFGPAIFHEIIESIKWHIKNHNDFKDM